MKKRMVMFCTAIWMLLNIFIIEAGIPVYAGEAGINQVRGSVVVVTIDLEQTEGKDLNYSKGTGFFIGDPEGNAQYLITNHHVIKQYLVWGAGEETTFSYTFPDESRILFDGKMKIRVHYDKNSYDEAYVVDYDEHKDIALLKLDKPTDKRKALRLCSPTEEMVGSTVYAVGYPGLSDNHFSDAVSKWEMTDASVTTGIIGRLITTAGTGVRQIQTDAALQSGNSGGPLVNENGCVLGVNVRTVYDVSIDEDNPLINYQDESHYAINIDEVIAMAKIHDVDCVVVSGNAETIEKESETIISTEINKKPTESSESEEPTETPPPPPPDDQDSNLEIIIAAAVIVVLLLIVILMLLGKKKKSSSTDGRQGGVSGKTAKKPVVIFLAAQHNGVRYPLNGQQILIGRSKSACAIVFEDKTPGVSGRHCSLGYDEASGDFLLTDMKSTYGTFLANGQKLSPGTVYRLKAGDQFYLGGNANMLRVELE